MSTNWISGFVSAARQSVVEFCQPQRSLKSASSFSSRPQIVCITGSSGTQSSYSTGNGGTQISYAHALDGVTVDLRAGTAHGTAANDIAHVGTDTFTQVSGVVGSNYDDILLGTDSLIHTDVFYGGAGNDFIDGRNGYDFVS